MSQGPQCSALFAVFGLFWQFFANFATIKKTFSKNPRASIILVLDATFLTNLTFLGLLSPEISFGEKTTHPNAHPDAQLRKP